MAKTQEELKVLKEEYETLNKKLKELTEEELKFIASGTGEGNYKYSFRKNDYVFINSVSRERFVVDEDVDTNDGDVQVNGHKSSSSQKERDVRYTAMSANAIYYNYLGNGGKLSTMN